jgi:hypothetical protein
MERTESLTTKTKKKNQKRNTLEAASLDTQTSSGIFKLARNPGIDSKVLIPPAYVAWRAGKITLFLVGSQASPNRLY